jgi:hypothetical protein
MIGDGGVAIAAASVKWGNSAAAVDGSPLQPALGEPFFAILFGYLRRSLSVSLIYRLLSTRFSPLYFISLR